MKFLSVVFTFLMPYFLSAQRINTLSNDYKIHLRMSPLTLLDPVETSFSAGADVKVASRISVGGDAAWYFARNMANNEWKPLNGFSLRPTVRFYTSQRLNFFAEAVFMYKYTSRPDEGWLGMDCVNGIPSYEKFGKYRFVKNIYDFSVRWGLRTPISSNRKFFLEYYMGIGTGMKVQNIRYQDANSCSVNDFNNGFDFFSTR
jgi:hypothetical protein